MDFLDGLINSDFMQSRLSTFWGTFWFWVICLAIIGVITFLLFRKKPALQYAINSLFELGMTLFIYRANGSTGWLVYGIILTVLCVIGVIARIVSKKLTTPAPVKTATAPSRTATAPAQTANGLQSTKPIKLSLQSDLLTYINNCLPTIVDYEKAAVTSYGSVSGENYTSDLDLYKALTDVVIPNYRKLAEGLDGFSVKLKTDEVRKLNEKYIEAVKTNMSAFVLLENLLDTQDASKAGDFTAGLEKGQMLIGKWQAELHALCNENGVQM
jgi:hypothetical protein